jgi:hypothetical protein
VLLSLEEQNYLFIYLRTKKMLLMIGGENVVIYRGKISMLSTYTATLKNVEFVFTLLLLSNTTKKVK